MAIISSWLGVILIFWFMKEFWISEGDDWDGIRKDVLVLGIWFFLFFWVLEDVSFY
jgi:hypothetical protein